jgi:hypothetical protein
MKTETNADFFILSRSPDKDVPSFVEMIWTPGLPKFHFPSGKINRGEFADSYSIQAKSQKFTGDYFLNDYVASDQFVDLCQIFSVDFISTGADITLLKGKKPEKSYNFFMPMERVDLLDEGNSVFSVSKDLETGELKTREAGLDSTYYDKIDLFVIRPEVDRHLFLCTELKKTVCSAKFKKAFEDARMSGIAFEPIDQNFRHDPWANFGSFGVKK